VAIRAKESGMARSRGRGGSHRRRPKAWGKNISAQRVKSEQGRLRAMAVNSIGVPQGEGTPLYSVHPNRSPSKGNGYDPQRTNDYMSHQSPSQQSNPDGPGGRQPLHPGHRAGTTSWNGNLCCKVAETNLEFTARRI
jgi:hypothetical protein